MPSTNNKNNDDDKPVEKVVKAPVAEKIPYVVKFGNVTDDGRDHEKYPRFLGDPKRNTLIDPPIEMIDPYFWFRDDDRSDPKVLALLEAENEYFEYMTRDQKQLEARIYSEHIAHITATEIDESAPIIHGMFKYWKRHLKGKSFPVYVRSPIILDASQVSRSSSNAAYAEDHDEYDDDDEDEMMVPDPLLPTTEVRHHPHIQEVLLDINALDVEATNQRNVEAVSPDPKTHSVIAYSLDTVGNELYTIHFKKLKNFHETSAPRLFPENIEEIKVENTNGEIVWLPNSEGILYTTRDEQTVRAEKIWFLSLQQQNAQPEPVLLFDETDALFSVSVDISLDGNYIFIRSFNYESTETNFCPLYKIQQELRQASRAAAASTDELDTVAEREAAAEEAKILVLTPEHFKPICPRLANHRYSVASWNAGHFLILTDWGSEKTKTNQVLYVHEDHLSDEWPTNASVEAANLAALEKGVPPPQTTNVILIPSIRERTIDTILSLRHGIVFSGYFDGLTQVWCLPVVEMERENIYSPSRNAEFFKRCFGLETAATNNSFGKLKKNKAKHVNNLLSSSFQMLTFKEEIYDLVLQRNSSKNFDSPFFRINYSSMITPNKWIEIDVTDSAPASRRILKEMKVAKGYNPKDYVVERRVAIAPDHTEVPMTILRKKTTIIPTEEEIEENDEDWEPPQGRHPCLIHGYAAYGGCVELEFQAAPLPLLNRGVVYVVAHCRGGAVGGRPWHLTGQLLTKRNSFVDFIACAESLIHEMKITTPSKLGIFGRSAGGLLVGAVSVMRPDLFKCVVSQVGFLDVLVTQSDSTIPLVTEEFKEFGNPNIYEHFHYMKSYDPIQNIMKGMKYPNVLVTAGYHDHRVLYSESLKFIQKLRDFAANKDEVDLIAKFDFEAGHFSSGDRFQWWKEVAEFQAWMLKKFGIEK
jgi:protease II